MKITKYLLSTLSAFFLFAFTQGASAHMLFTYQSSEMKWITEKSYSSDGVLLGIDALWYNSFQFDITLITPDLDLNLDELEVRTMQFDNPIVSVSPSGLFRSPIVERSNFWLEAYKIDGHVYTDWTLTFDITDGNLPSGTLMTAAVTARGNWDYMTLDIDNFFYSRTGFTDFIDIDAEFAGEFQGQHPDEYPGGVHRLFGKHISVPEPLTPALLLTGLLGIFTARKLKSKINS